MKQNLGLDGTLKGSSADLIIGKGKVVHDEYVYKICFVFTVDIIINNSHFTCF